MGVENTKRPHGGVEQISLNEQVLTSELRYRRLFEAARDGIFLLDIDTLRITDANPFMTELLGYTLDEFIGRELWELGVFSDKEASKEAFRVLQKEGYLRYDDLPLKTKDGQSREVEFVSNVYSEGDVQVIQCNIRDITERKHLKSEQAAIEGRFQTLFEYAPDGILIANPESYYLEANASMCRMLGYTREELIGLHAKDIVIPSEIVHIGEALVELKSAADHHRVWQFRRKDGSEFSGEVLVTKMPDGNLLAMVRNITYRKKSDDEKAFLISQLESERRRLDNIVVSIPGVVWETARVRAPVSEVRDFVSGYVLQMLGYTVEEWLATPNLWLAIVHPDDRERVGKFADAAFVVGQDVTDEYRCLTKDGRVIWVETRSTPIIDDNGKAVGLRGVTIDITERRRAEEELRDNEERFSAAFEFAPIGVALVLPDGRWLKVNRAVCKLTGYSEDELLESTFQHITHPDDLADDMDHVRRLLAGEISYYQIEKRYIHKLGHTVSVLLNVSLVRDDIGDPRYFISQIQDITERKRAENRLRESESLLAASQRISHAGSWVLDFEGDGEKPRERWSDEHYRIYGFEPDDVEITDELFYNSVHPDDRERLAETISAAIAERRSFDIEHRIVLPDGRERVVHAMAEFVLDEQTGKPKQLLGSVQDITERKRAEEDLQRREAELRVLFDLMPAMIWFKDTQNNILRVNRRAADAVGLSVGEIEGRPANEIYPEKAEKSYADDLEVLKARTVKLGSIEMITTADGQQIWAQADRVPYYDREGEPIGIVVMAHDVTERENAEKALVASEERYRSVVETAPDVIVTIDDSSTICFANPAAERIFGHRVDELIGKSLSMLMPENLRRLHGVGIERYQKTGAKRVSWEYLETTGLHKSGREIPITISFSEFIQNDHRYFTGIIRDISERKLAMEALRESEERYRELFENAIDVIYTQDLEGNFTSVNKAAETITGYKKAEALTMNVSDIVAPEFEEQAKRMMVERLAGEDETAYELDLIAKDGRRITVEVKTRSLYEKGRSVGVQGIARDVTTRKQIEAALRSSEASFKSLFDAANDAIMVLSGGRFLDCNHRTELLFGRPKKDIIGRTPVELSPPVQPDGRTSSSDVSIYMAPALEGEPQFFEWQHIRPDGTLFDAEVSLNRVDFGGAPHLQAIVRDVTERKLVKAALEAAEENYRSIFENAVEGIFQSTPDGRFISANPALARILGYDSPEELLADRVDINTQHYVDPICRAELRDILAREGVAEAYECEVFRKDRSRIWTRENIRAVRSSDGTVLHFEGSLSDITDRKSLEGQLRQSQKMEAVGVLAGGIAHDFNNLLTAINGYSSLTLKKMSEDDRCRNYIVEVKNAGDRAAELTSQLLAFSRKQVLQPVVINLNTVVSSFERMLRRIIKESIELRVVLDEQLGNVRADPGQIEQVIMNLAINARDAMPEGGTLIVETKHVMLDEHFVSQHATMKAGEFVRLTVADTGDGMSVETQSHIFEPFFTTKEPGKGTGLGLSTVYGIVKQSGGDISVYSELGHGTTFKIYLPRVAETIQKPKWTDKVVAGAGSETILLVEDEDIVRTFVKTILAGDGYEVLEASNGHDALEIARSFDEPIHLLLTDLIMPKMSGTELKEKIQKIRPDIKNLFMSGYTDDSISHQGVLISGTAFIEKPFTPDSLFRKIREVLES